MPRKDKSVIGQASLPPLELQHISPTFWGCTNPAIDPFTSRFGDLDDVLSLTTPTLDNPYRGVDCG